MVRAGPPFVDCTQWSLRNAVSTRLPAPVAKVKVTLGKPARPDETSPGSTERLLIWAAYCCALALVSFLVYGVTVLPLSLVTLTVAPLTPTMISSEVFPRSGTAQASTSRVERDPRLLTV